MRKGAFTAQQAREKKKKKKMNLIKTTTSPKTQVLQAGSGRIDK